MNVHVSLDVYVVVDVESAVDVDVALDVYVDFDLYVTLDVDVSAADVSIYSNEYPAKFFKSGLMCATHPSCLNAPLPKI